MQKVDTTQLKEKIISFIRSKGPSLPVHIANEIEQSMLFASAFLSELMSEKRLKISNLRIGSSPLYFIPGQETGLDKFGENLKSKEKETYYFLKQRGIVKDSQLDSPMRVAIREIKDFAYPVKKGEELYWRYLTYTEEPQVETPKPEIKVEPVKEPIVEEKKETSGFINAVQQEFKRQEQAAEPKEAPKVEPTITVEKEVEIFDKEPVKETIEQKIEIKEKPKPVKKKATRKKADNKDSKFFNSIKETLASKNIEITDIVGVAKTDYTLKIRENGTERLLVAFNKKRITEEDIVKAYKKAADTGLKFTIMSKGEPAKKTLNLIEAIRNLTKLDQILE